VKISFLFGFFLVIVHMRASNCGQDLCKSVNAEAPKLSAQLDSSLDSAEKELQAAQVELCRWFQIP
jgi:hypothetical protein